MAKQVGTVEVVCAGEAARNATQWPLKVYFDISTSARWSGHAVGIVRVERELARRSIIHRNADGGGFCIYVPSENGIRIVPDDLALEILSGKATIDFQAGARERQAAERRASARGRLRNLILSQPRLYQQVQRVRGRSLSLDQVMEIRRVESRKAADPDTTLPAIRVLSVEEAAPVNLALGPDVLIVSGGLDWEYKDLRGIYRMKSAHGFRYASIIYDLIPILYPHFVVPSYVTLLRDYFGEVFWLSDLCLCISKRTELDVKEYCHEWGVGAPLSDHFRLGGDLPSTPSEEASLPESLHGKRYAIFVSTIEPRKNHRTVYQAWDRAVRAGRIDPQTCRMVFVGMGGWNTAEFRAELAANPVTKDTIITLANVSDAVLRQLYEKAEFSIFPSFYEGYGLPVAESLSYGTPCICSDAGSLPEIAGDLIQYVDPGDPIAWCEALVEAFSTPEAMEGRRALLKERYKPVSWEAAASEFFSKLAELAGEASA